MRFYSALYEHYYPFDKLYPQAEFKVVRDPDDLDSGPGNLIIWGGGDIHPSIYNRPNFGSHVGEKLSMRDELEVALFKRAVERGHTIIGICRGAQLGCALSGGILIQDVSGHNSDHFMETIQGEHILTSSLHHQMMYPWDIHHELIAWSLPNAISGHWRGLSEDEEERWELATLHIPFIEPEIVWFPETKCLAIQGHPEFCSLHTRFVQYTKELIDQYGVR